MMVCRKVQPVPVEYCENPAQILFHSTLDGWDNQSLLNHESSK